MALIYSKPTSPGRRGEIRVVHHHLHKGKPFEALVESLQRSGGRNNTGRITVRHIGGGHKRKYRLIDFKRTKDKIEAKVERIEYDPNRTALIALVVYRDGEKRYILAPKSLKAGDLILSGEDAPISVGNCLPLKNIPLGTTIHGIELKPGGGAQLLRSAGCYGQVVAKEGMYVTIKLRSGEMRKILTTCRAVIGEVSNGEHNLSSRFSKISQVMFTITDFANNGTACSKNFSHLTRT